MLCLTIPDVFRSLVLSVTTLASLSTAPGAHGQAAITTRSAGDTLARFERITSDSRDSVQLVRAADDALQGKFGVTVPMSVTAFRRTQRGVEVSLRLAKTPGVEWKELGGTVRILSDGRRVVLNHV